MNLSAPSVKLGHLLRAEREQRRESLAVVAAAIGMQLAHLSKLERGDRLPTLEQAAALAKYFDLNESRIETMRRAEGMLWTYGDEAETWAAIGILNEAAGHYSTASQARAIVNNSVNALRKDGG